jgi:hypothetical protein
MGLSMSQANFPLDQVRIASPCSAPWAEMQGDDRVRFCTQCKLNVYNISAMNREEAEALVQSAEGRLCINFYRRQDGTILTRDCPVGLNLRRRALAKSLAAASVVFGMFLGIAGALGLPRTVVARLQSLEPFSRLALLFPTPPPPVRTAGSMALGKLAPARPINLLTFTNQPGNNKKR